MDNPLGLLLLVLFSSFTLSQESEAGLFVEKYDWLATESAHAKFPMKLVHGSLHLKDGSSVYVPSKAIFHNGWGETGSIHITGSKYKALPTRLTLSWFSFAENRFYSGDFQLPYDKILQLFKNGFKSPITREKSTYEWIVIGMGPGAQYPFGLPDKNLSLRSLTMWVEK